MKRFNKAVIVGVGLIGGSIGLALRKNGLARSVVGLCRRKQSMDKALKYGACDSVTMDAREAFKDADLIVVCTPVSKIPGTVVSALKISGTDAVITDAGSTKSCIVKAVEKAIKGRLRYVGSHPMAGSEKKGVPFASKDLFKGAVCVLTPTSRTERAAYSVIKAMWQALGARCVDLDPVEHDRVMSEISHMPHIIAASVAGTPERKSLRFAATGFCDTTRIAASDPELWADIFSDNRKELLLAIKKFTENLKKVGNAVKRNDRASVVRFLKKAQEARGNIDRSCL